MVSQQVCDVVPDERGEPAHVLARRFEASRAEVHAALLASGMASDGSRGAAALRPLVIDAQGRLYLARYYDYERRLARSLVGHARERGADEAGAHIGSDDPALLTEVTVADFDLIMGLNVRAAFFTAQAVVRTFCAERGIAYYETGVVQSFREIMGHFGAVSAALETTNWLGTRGKTSFSTSHTPDWAYHQFVAAPLNLVQYDKVGQTPEDAPVIWPRSLATSSCSKRG